MNMQNNTVLITGASSGFGLETAKLFAKQGARLILLARRLDRLNKLALELQEKYQTQCLSLAVDITDYSKVEEEFKKVQSFGYPDILINNAGLVKGLNKLWETPPSDWDVMIDTNVKGILTMCRLLIPEMLKKKTAQIINIGSTSGHDTYPGGSVYCSTKFAVRALSDTLRKELIETNIRVSLISPGMAKTEFSDIRFDGDKEKAEKVYEGVVPLTAEDIAEAILFVATRPEHVNIADIVIYPKAQASATMIYRK